VASFGKADGEWIEEWLGTAMFFSHHNPRKIGEFVRAAGLRLEMSETLRQDNEAAEFLWIRARKPR